MIFVTMWFAILEGFRCHVVQNNDRILLAKSNCNNKPKMSTSIPKIKIYSCDKTGQNKQMLHTSTRQSKQLKSHNANKI